MLRCASQTAKVPLHVSLINMLHKVLSGQSGTTRVFHGQLWVVIIHNPHFFLGSNLDLSHIRLIDNPTETMRPTNDPAQTQRPANDSMQTERLTNVPLTISLVGAALLPVPHRLEEKLHQELFCRNGRTPTSKLEPSG